MNPVSLVEEMFGRVRAAMTRTEQEPPGTRKLYAWDARCLARDVVASAVVAAGSGEEQQTAAALWLAAQAAWRESLGLPPCPPRSLKGRAA